LENENIEDMNLPVDDNTLKEILSKEISEETEKILSSLSEEDRRIFKELYIENKDIDEVSQDMGLDKSVLYNRLSRGKKKIRKEVKGGY
jgi:RNA polymerase sigma-70 factor (ECF subfamily)